jgi:signal transduction histidine kinase/ligand-binding sensor domain-containing protein/DNA-binding response OmpR family regulator
MTIIRILYIFLFHFICIVNLYSQKKRFFDYNEGLSNSLVNQLYQDHLGFIWVGTEDGLNRFDGIQFKSYSHNAELTHFLGNNYITAIFEDSKNNFFVANINGLVIYNIKNETFQNVELTVDTEKEHLFITSLLESKEGHIWIATAGHGLIRLEYPGRNPIYYSELSKKLNSIRIEHFIEDKEGIIWLGTSNGVNSYNPKTGEIKSYLIDNISLEAKSNEVTSLCEDDSNNIYIGLLNGGLLRLNKKTELIEKIFTNKENESELPIRHVLFDSKKRLWVGTDGFGLKILNKRTNKLENYTSVNTPFNFLKSKVHSIIEDNAGNIWLGIFQKGIYLIPESPEIFINYGYRAFDATSIGSNCITDIEGDSKELWIATDGDGMYNLNLNNQEVRHIPLTYKNGNRRSSNILTLHNDADFIWLGRYIDGLIRFNKKDGSFKTFESKSTLDNKLRFDKITDIKKINDDQLLLGTLGDGIARFDIKKKRFYEGLDIPDSLNQSIPKWILCIYIDKEKNLWVGSYIGMLYINLKDKTLELYTVENKKLPNNTVVTIQSDSKGNIWAGTYAGIVKIIPDSSKIKSYTESDGLCNNIISAIQEDEYGRLWISTHNGLSVFEPEKETFTNYYSSDGIQANEFSRNSTFKNKDNELFFGGINGITKVKRDYTRYTQQVRDVLLTDFYLSGKNVKVGDKSGKHIVLNKSVVLADTVRLHERDNIFSIGFTSAEIAHQSQINYEYKMEGFDLNWRKTDSQNRRATYTNLNHGKYTFLVRGVDKNKYSEIRKLTLIIYPLWYKTSWAKIIWVLLIGFLIYIFFLLYREKLLRVEAERINELKMQFFINISHELKTPLSLILDPLEKLIKQNKEKKNDKFFQIIKQNAYRINRLVNQLMDVRRIDKGQLIIKYQQINIYQFIKEVAQSYDILASEKNISFEILAKNKDLLIWIDALNFEKVILNLLSNAFKFTPAGGKVEINIFKEVSNNLLFKGSEVLHISVSDSGIGIKESEKEKIFDRFYQVDTAKKRYYSTGTGIGLHLSRSLVEMHKGQLFVENKKGKQGSQFVILLRFGNEHLPKEDLITKENLLPLPFPRILKNPEMEVFKDDSEKNDKPKSNDKIMIVEDEINVRNYLISELSDQYKIVACENGKQAKSILVDENPDLIISDIMMPEMDGITFCRSVKGNILTSHIPVILLTALSKEEDKLEGIETGADFYLTKPFNSELLKKMIINIFENRKKVLYNKDKQPELDIDNSKIKSHDEVLIQKVMTIVKDNLSNSELNVEMLAEGIGISRVHMHRKLKELTNQSARDLIKSIRLKQAAYLLATKKINISEVAYSVGYSNLSHFSNSFKSFFGVSPKEYIQKQSNAIEP